MYFPALAIPTGTTSHKSLSGLYLPFFYEATTDLDITNFTVMWACREAERLCKKYQYSVKLNPWPQVLYCPHENSPIEKALECLFKYVRIDKLRNKQQQSPGVIRVS